MAACAQCRAELEPGALACDSCHALVHAGELDRLVAGARADEERGETAAAREAWVKALCLLPPESTQFGWVSDQLRRLDTTPLHLASSRWMRLLGPLAPLAVLLANGKFLLILFKLQFLLSLAAFVAFYWALYGFELGLGFAALVLLHEMGHFIEVRRRGLPADMPVFLPGLGAYVRWTALGVSAETRAFIGLAGPCAGCVAAGVCVLLWRSTGDGLWIALASLSALLNVLNLIPVWVLDGAQAIGALDRTQRIGLSVTAVLMAAFWRQPALLLVAAGAGYRVFTKDLPAEPCGTALAYYVCLLTALGSIMALAPPLPGHPSQF
jgi:Zn-dependent protease